MKNINKKIIVKGIFNTGGNWMSATGYKLSNGVLDGILI